MKIIRGEALHDVALLTSEGELLVTREERIDLAEEDLSNAFKKGEERGVQEGYARAQEETKVLIALLQTIARKVLDQKKRLLERVKPEMIEFSMGVCERIIRSELSHPQAFVKLINSLIQSATPALKDDTLQIVLSPDDFILLEKSFTHIHYDKREIEGIRFVSDSLMRRGDCRIETKIGLLNYDISRELTDLQAKILQR